MNYINNSPWMDITLKFSEVLDGKISDVAHKIELSEGGSGRSDAVRNVGNALSVISANILKQYFVFPHLNLMVDLSNDGYPSGEFNPYRISISSVRKVIRYMTKSKPAFISMVGGNYDKSRNIGYPTQIRGTDHFIEFLMGLINHKKPCNTGTYPITRKTFNYDYYCMIKGNIFDLSPVPIIRLREGSSRGNSEFISFNNNDAIKDMEDNLNTYNNYIKSHWLDIFVADQDFYGLQRQEGERIDEFGNIKLSKPVIDLVSGRSLYRVFNNGNFDHGGRFYGGWWQNIPSDYRRFITINGIPTVEVDFSSMQLAMLYAKIGQDLKGDAYAIEGIDPSYRNLVKTTTLKLINGKGRLSAPLKSALPENMTWKELQALVLERHKPIAEFFHSGEGIRLQRLDSDIAEEVIMEMLAKEVVALPIHDSFIVPEGNLDSLCSVMLAAYQRKMDRTIGLKKARSLFDDLLIDQINLTATERHRLGMARFLAKKQAPEYRGYRKREEWAAGAVTNGIANLGDVKQIPPSVPLAGINLTGPRASLGHSGRRWLPRPLERVWDRSQGAV
ncbi:hypothetical protein ACVCNR_05765 [Aquamicrobium terrae]